MCKRKPCDGPGGAGWSVEAACADTAVDDPERKDKGVSTFLLPELKGERHEDQGVKNADEEEGRASEEEENVKDTGFLGKDNKRWKRYTAQHQETADGGDVTGALSAAQEVHSEDTSHTSGEAWHHQVRLGTG
ncbi:hypothetical protein NDU88_005455 [Pleurodeles waltl]|uniref:Uncharacterized protein n=1 Tax=Pleurodeles waltl TaxID=8319 RepID=A0AAV7SLN4_PLEWA|nr:hypothetical protein NDU88_005455 [Pleurodeles waltl]